MTPALPASTGVLATIALVKRRGPQRLLFAALATALCTHPGVAAVLPEALPDGYPREDLDVLRGSAVERYIREIEAEKGALTEPERKVDHEIRRVLQPPPSFGPRLQEPAPGLQLALSIRLRSAEPQEVEELVRRGFELERLDQELMRAEGRAHPGDVYRLAELPFVAALRPVHPAWLRVGSATTEGDAASRADLVRAQGYDGSGIVVGVISDGVDNGEQARATGDLPPITVPDDPRCRRGHGDEGTALLEIVHDLAPGARLLFSSGSESPLVFVDAVRCLAAAGANVIVDDLAFFDEPFFGDGLVNAAVKAAIQAGVSYHSAAGNEADIHLEQMYRPSPGTRFHDFLGGPVDNSEDVSVGPFGTVNCILQWNDPFGGATNDYDLLALDANLDLIAQSTNSQTGTEDPFEEVVIFNPAPAPQTFKVAIVKAAGESRLLKLFCLGASAEQYVTPAGSIVGQAALREAVAVGAINVSDPGLDTVETYSSEGPASIFFPAPETRPKPDIAAFDGVSISNAGGFPLCPPFCVFFGTSAAAPHSAAVAALLLSKNPFLTPAGIQDVLRTTAVDIGAPGPDDGSGAGRLDALAAADAVRSPECVRNADCSDGNACTTDACDRGACRYERVPDGTTCNDGNACTQTDTCQTGVCTGTNAVVCPAPDQCHDAGTCDPAIGTCSNPGKPDGSTCNDGNACTRSDTCQSAVCMEGTPIVCPAPDQCHDAGTCNPATGTCSNPAKADGSACNDGNACTQTDTCQSGVCTSGNPLVCNDDHEPCTDDTCDPQRGCVHSPVTGVRSVTCWLDGIDQALGTAPATEIRAPVRRRIGTAVLDLTTRIQLTAEAARAGDSRQESRMLHTVRRSFKRLEQVTTRARHNHRMTRSLASIIRTRLGRATAELILLL